MNFVFKMPLIAFTAALVTLSAYAVEQKVEIAFGDQHLQGENTLFLKQELKAQFPGIKLNRLRLERVRLVAKSKQGQGLAKLQVGSESTFAYTVGGSPSSFLSTLPASFDRIDINRPGYDSEGVWQVHLKGNIIVRKVVMFFEEDAHAPIPDHGSDDWGSDDWGSNQGSLKFSSVDSVYVDRFESSERVAIRERDVKAIRLSSERGTIRVVEAVATFADGTTQNLFELEGTFFEGDDKTIRFVGRKDVLALRLTTIARSSGRLGKLDIAVATR